MTTLQVRRATVRSRLSIVEIDDDGNRTRYIAENVIEDYAQKLAAAPELLEALKAYRKFFSHYVNTSPAYLAVAEMADAAIAKAEAQK